MARDSQTTKPLHATDIQGIWAKLVSKAPNIKAMACEIFPHDIQIKEGKSSVEGVCIDRISGVSSLLL